MDSKSASFLNRNEYYTGYIGCYMSEIDKIISDTDKTLLQIDNTSLITSIAFINICFGLIYYLRGNKPPFGEEVCNLIIGLLTFIYVSFLICAWFTYGDMLNKSYSTVKEATRSVKCVSYILGVLGFTLVTLVLLIKS